MVNGTQPTAATNLFGFDTPSDCRCNVYRYHSGLSRLYIRVFKGMSEEPLCYLLFSDVGYYEGPFNWQGADFQRGHPDDCLQLMGDAGLVENIMLDDPDTRAALAEAVHLYRVETGFQPVQIIAGDAIRLEAAPDDV